MLTGLHESAAGTWWPVKLDALTFAHHLGRAVAGTGEVDDRVALAALHTADLYLACAAGSGADHAADRLVQHCASAVAGYARAIHDAPGFLDEVQQTLHDRLLVPTEEPPRILQYGGRAPLPSWVGVAAQRTALSLLRADGAYARAAKAAGTEPLMVELDPELLYLKQRYRGSFEAAIASALAQLPARQRAVLRLQTVGGLTLARIAPMFGVEESTVSRWLQSARRTVLARTQEALEASLGVTDEEFASIARLVASQLDVSVARLLTEAEAEVLKGTR